MKDKQKRKIPLWTKLTAAAAVLALVVLAAFGTGSTGLKKHAVPAGETAEVNPLKGLFPFSADVDFPYSLEAGGKAPKGSAEHGQQQDHPLQPDF